MLTIISLPLEDPSINTLEKVKAAHNRSSAHRNEVLQSEYCGCFYCCTVFKSDAISSWIDKNSSGVGQTALCPNCGIDSVIGDKSPFPIKDDFLVAMRKYWFSTSGE